MIIYSCINKLLLTHRHIEIIKLGIFQNQNYSFGCWELTGQTLKLISFACLLLMEFSWVKPMIENIIGLIARCTTFFLWPTINYCCFVTLSHCMLYVNFETTVWICSLICNTSSWIRLLKCIPCVTFISRSTISFQ